MPKSKKRHRHPYEPKPVAEQRLKDVDTPLRTIVAMSIHPQTKKRMLNRVVWLVVELTGNFNCRYRSAGVLANAGVRVQRDHVFPRKVLIEELLKPTPDYASVIERAQCCVVTHAEHKLLSDVPKGIVGWDRYKQAGVVWHDMLTYRVPDA